MDTPPPPRNSVVPAGLGAGPVEPLSGRILVVEDDLLNQILVRRMLEKRGLTTSVAGDGVAAVDLVEHQAWDLILMDCQLPGIDGFEATRLIRAGRNGRRVPIVALTASPEAEVRAACAAAGMDDFLTKPVRSAELQACLSKWLKSAPTRPPSPD